PLKPNTPKPTTPNPMTAPPANATSKALPKEVLAACVVLTLALVATFMPIKPANAEQMEPTINDTATMPFEPTSLFPFKNNKIATAITKTDKILYSAFRKDIAPSEILLAILIILSLPWSCLVTQALFTKTNKSPKTPKSGKKFTINSILKFC